MFGLVDVGLVRCRGRHRVDQAAMGIHPMCVFIPKCHALPFLVELGAAARNASKRVTRFLLANSLFEKLICRFKRAILPVLDALGES